MRHHNFTPNGFARFICLLLIYSFVISSGWLIRPRTKVFAATSHIASNARIKNKGGQREGELLVRFRLGTPDHVAKGVIESKGAHRANELRGRSRIEKIHLAQGQDSEMVAAMLRADPNVELVEPNFLISHDDITPNDPRFSEQWALQNTGAGAGVVGADINVAPAWDKTTGNWHTTIAVIDSGIDFSHPELKNMEWLNPREVENGLDDDNDGLIDDLHGWDWVTGLNEIKDEQGHGTAVAGIIAAQGNNGVGTSGVMWQASLMSLRVLDKTGSGDIANAVEAIDYAVDHGAQVINCSWGTDEVSQSLHDAVARAASRGVLVVASAGNDGRNIDDAPYYPASYSLPNIIAVGSTDNQDRFASWSNWGPTRVAVAAPGTSILTTKMGGGYQEFSGSSASAPLVTGVAGLLATAFPTLRAAGMRSAILQSVRQVSGLGGKVSSGGVVNAAGALDAASTNPSVVGSGIVNLAGGVGGQTGSGSQAGGTGASSGGSSSGQTPGAGTADPSLPDLDASRNLHPPDPAAGRIHSNSTGCPTCGGGLGGNPVADTGGPYTGQTGVSVQFDGSLSSDDGTITSYSWGFGDGYIGSGISPTHTYTSAGTYAVSLTITDDSGASASASSTVTISSPNPPPVARPGGPYSGTAFQSISFSGAGSSSANGTITSYSWSFGDGATGTGATPVHIYSVASTYTVSLTVTDSLGGTNTATTTATISTFTNKPPVSIPGGLYGGQVGQSIAFNGSNSYDPDGTIASYSWNFGDGGTATGATPSHAYSTAGTYTISLTVTDNGGLASTATTDATISSSGGSSTIYTALMDPSNSVGGESPFSQNIGWQIPILGLPGRAGMNVGLGLSYNSLVWTKENSAIGFNLDQGFPSPGFHLGFATIQTGFNTQLGATTFLLIAPSGARVEFRQIGNSNVYETADSSYTQLTVNSSSQLSVRSTDGSTTIFSQTSSAPLTYKVSSIEDRNGNYITVTYNGSGNPAAITDTLGRVVSFVYDGTSHLLTSITQTWSGQTHTWATFVYGQPLTIQTNYGGLALVGANNGQQFSVLTQIGLADGSAYNFTYNTYGQVYLITHLAADGHQLGHTSYNLPLSATALQTDCPRFTERHDFAENWNLQTNGQPDLNGTATEAVTYYSITNNAAWTTLAGGSDTGILTQITAPDGTVSKSYSHSSGWDKGMPRLIETWAAGSTLMQQVYTDWIQDNTNLGYVLNPRLTETNVIDPVNNDPNNPGHHPRRRSKVDYAAIVPPTGTTVHLASDLSEYQADAITVYRKTHTDYNLSQTYLNLRIIGLTSAKYVYDVGNNNKLASHVEYIYDDGGAFLVPQSGAIQHDDASFGASYIQGRANPTRVHVFDVNSGAYLESQAKYNTTGTIAATVDAAGHVATVSYSDSFSSNPDNPSGSTFAYPTMATDPDGFSATIQYNYDFGAVVLTTDPKGAQKKVAYDSVGRVSQQTYHDSVNNVDGTYTRYVYPTSQNIVQSFTLTQTGGPEAYSAQILDGAGRARASAADFGATGHYRGQKTLYDVMGRVIKQSNPIEMTSGWAPAGDDDPANPNGTGYGWSYTNASYDWAGRPLLKTNTDQTTRSVSYNGCACAGSDVTVLTDEMNRRQRVTTDFLGRTYLTEVLNPDGSTYESTTKTYNVLGQVTQSVALDVAANVSQLTSISYDGLGRLATGKKPAEANASSFTYNADGTTASATDARGVVTTYGYNNRQQVTSLSFSAPAGVANTATISYGYDAAGNRTSMSDGSGARTYTYDTWSRLTGETRTFAGLTGSYSLSYGYNLAGQLTSVTDPSHNQVLYAYDQTGQLTAVNGAGYTTREYVNDQYQQVPVTQFASNFKFRAWGSLEYMSYPNNVAFDASYNRRLQVARTYSDASHQYHSDYQYYADGKINTMMTNTPTPSIWDRKYSYDSFGRLQTALSGNEARGGTTDDGPYHETYQYNAFDNVTSRYAGFWSTSTSYTTTYVNGLDQNSVFRYDASGNATKDQEGTHIYDALGKQTSFTSTGASAFTLTQLYDGDGIAARHSDNHFNINYPVTTYFLTSSALGGKVLAEIDQNGNIQKTKVYAGGLWIASVEGLAVIWRSENPVTHDSSSTYADGSGGTEAEALGPLGQILGFTDPTIGQNQVTTDYTIMKGDKFLFAEDGDPFSPYSGCELDGMARSCGDVNRLADEGGVETEGFGSETGKPMAGPPVISVGLGFTFLGDQPQDSAPKTYKWWISKKTDANGNHTILRLPAGEKGPDGYLDHTGGAINIVGGFMDPGGALAGAEAGHRIVLEADGVWRYAASEAEFASSVGRVAALGEGVSTAAIVILGAAAVIELTLEALKDNAQFELNMELAKRAAPARTIDTTADDPDKDDGDRVYFAHGTSRAFAEQINLTGVSEAAILQSGKGSWYPGAFFATLLNGGNLPLQVAFELGNRNTIGDPAVMIGSLPRDVFNGLEAAGLISVGPLRGVPGVTEIAFKPGSFPALNLYNLGRWQIITPR